MTLALYRRYRPDTFADLIGQEHVTDPLRQALRTGRANHAYLFSGPRGCGKTTSARILARCLNCEQGPTDEPCGVCASCVQLARGGPGSVDVIEIDAASHGGVDDARDLRERASYAPAQSRYKIYIIDEAHMVTTQGFNALLKIVEEPPEHVKFVFATTEPEKVIGTIRSRTHHYPFRLVAPGRLSEYLQQLCESEGVAVAPGVMSFVVRAGGGSVRDALSVLDQLIAGSGEEGLTYERAAALLGFTDTELLDATIDGLAAGDAAAVFRQVEKVVDTGVDPRRFVEDLLERLRDLIVVAAVPDGAASVFRGMPVDQVERMRTQQAAFGPGALSRAADLVYAGLTEMTGATSPRLQLELICARVLLPGASGEQGYASRIERLERRLDMGGVPTAGAVAGTAGVPAGGSGAAPVPASPVSGPAASAATVAPVMAVPAAAAPPTTSVAGEAAPVRAAASRAGAMDTESLRRLWPDVLKKVFEMRRATWSFLNEHAQVHSHQDGRLVLAIANPALTNVFRSGNHAELVRQALIDAIGLDVIVEAVVAGDPSPATTGSPPAGRAAVGRPDPGRPTTNASARPGAGPSVRRAAAADAPSAPTPAATPMPAAGVPDDRQGRPRTEREDAARDRSARARAGRAAAFQPESNSGWGVGTGGPPEEPPSDDDAPLSAEDEEVLRAGAQDLDVAAGPDVIRDLLGGHIIGEETG